MKKESENGHIYCHVWTKFRTEAGKKNWGLSSPMLGNKSLDIRVK